MHHENDRAQALRDAKQLREYPREPAGPRMRCALRASREELPVRGAPWPESRGANTWKVSRREAVRGPRRMNANRSAIRNVIRIEKPAETHAQAAERLARQGLPLQEPRRELPHEMVREPDHEWERFHAPGRSRDNAAALARDPAQSCDRGQLLAAQDFPRRGRWEAALSSRETLPR